MLAGGEQVGPGNISVVSPPGPCGNGTQGPFAGAAAHPQYGDAPPEYSEGFDNGAFDDRAVRRGEPGLKGGWETFHTSSLAELPSLISRVHQEGLPDLDAPAAGDRGHHLRLYLLVRRNRAMFVQQNLSSISSV